MLRPTTPDAQEGRERHSARPSRAASGLFVGREREMAELRAALDATLAGAPRLVLIGGEPGVGKTRIACEIERVARGRGFRTLWGRCHDGSGPPARWPWIQVLRELMPPLDDGGRGRPGAAEVARLVPEAADNLPDAVPPAHDSAEAPFRLADGLAAFLRAAAEERPLLVVLDDLHAADAASLRLLRFLAGALSDGRLLVLGTYRSVEIGRDHPFRRELGELARTEATGWLALSGVDERAVARYIALAAGVTPPASLVTAVFRRTEGNPFFLGEVVRLLLAEGGLDASRAAADAIPPGVREAVARRLARLSRPCADVLAAASVLGREFALSVLGGATGLAREQLLAPVEEAVRAGFLAEVEAPFGHLRFVHTFVRETIYQDLGTADRVRLHRRTTDVLEAMYHANVEAHVAELAHHAFAAAPGGGVGRAVGYSVQAGDRAAAALAWGEAARHYERALQALEWGAPTESDESIHCELLLALGETQHKAGDLAGARQSFERAAAFARRLRSSERLARAALGSGARWAEIGLVDHALVALLQEALRAVGDDDSTVRARLLGRLARELYWTDARALRESLAEQAVAMAGRLGDPATLAEVVAARRYVLWGPANLPERLEMATRVVVLAERTAYRETALMGRVWRMGDLLEQGDVPGVRAELDACTPLADELRQPIHRHTVAVIRATVAILLGRFAEAERLALAAFELGRRVQPELAAQALGMQIGTIRREQGRLAEMRDGARAQVERYPATPIWRCGLAYIHAEIGEEAEARQEFERLALRDFAALPRDFTWISSVTSLAEVCAHLHDAARAARLYDLLLPFAERNVVVGPGVGSYGAAAHYLGTLAATMERWDAAEAHFASAVAMNERMGARAFVVEDQRAWVTMLVARRAPGDLARARALLEPMLAAAEELGMRAVIEKGHALRRAIESARAPAPRAAAEDGARAPGPPAAIVFRREGEYWTIGRPGRLVRLKDAKGFRYLDHLLRHPGQEVHALELIGVAAGGPGREPAAAGAGMRLDARAKTDYRRRLEGLREEVAEAERFNDPVRAARAREAMELLAEELATAVGLGGRDRAAACDAERARLTVTKRIKAALAKIVDRDPALGGQIQRGVKTGYLCVFTPPAG